MEKYKNGYRERVTIGGKRIAFYSSETSERKAKSDILRKINEYKEKLEDGEDFYNVAEEWWESAESELSVQSIPTYKKCLERAQDYFQCPINDIDTQMVNDYLNELRTRNFAFKTIQKHKMVLSLIFKYAYTEGYAEENPVPLATLPRARKAIRHSASTDDELKIESSPISESFLLPYLCYYAGMRKGEAIALQWQDIDLENRVIVVSQSCAFDSNKPMLKSPKTESGIRTIPIVEPLAIRLAKHRKKRGYVVSGSKLYGKTWYRDKIEQFQRRYGIAANPHELRHSFATNCLEAGVDIKTTSTIIGHRDISTTLNIYTDVRNKQIKKARESLNQKYQSEKSTP